METKLSMRLKELRKTNLYSTKKIVKELKKLNLNYSEQSIYKWEDGTVIPDVRIIEALAKIYNCNPSYIVDVENNNYENLTNSEIFLLQLFRNDFLFRSIAMQIMRRIKRNAV